MRIQTKSEIRSLLEAAGTNPQKKWGQNFLIDGNLMRMILEAADVCSDDVVLEIGTGTGALTEHLVELAGKVVAVEIDPVLYGIVTNRIGERGDFAYVCGDVLTSKHVLSAEVADALSVARTECCGRMMLVANLPYNVATPLLMNLMTSSFGFGRYCFTVQREMADRFLGAAGTKDYGPVGVVSQTVCDVQRVANLPPSVFWPPPAVDSSIVLMEAKPHAFEGHGMVRAFADLLRGAFAFRRKTLFQNLRRTIDAEKVEELGGMIDLSRRAETVGVAEWTAIGGRVLGIDSVN